MVPTSISKNLAFIIDLDLLDDPTDILADDRRNNGVNVTYFTVTVSNKVENINKTTSDLAISHSLDG